MLGEEAGHRGIVGVCSKNMAAGWDFDRIMSCPTSAQEYEAF